MELVYGFLGGFVSGSGLLLCYGMRFIRRVRLVATLETQSEMIENQRDAIESDRDTVARRSDYVVSEADLLGTVPGVMTKDHLQDIRNPAKVVDLSPNWTTLEYGTGSDPEPDETEIPREARHVD